MNGSSSTRPSSAAGLAKCPHIQSRGLLQAAMQRLQSVCASDGDVGSCAGFHLKDAPSSSSSSTKGSSDGERSESNGHWVGELDSIDEGGGVWDKNLLCSHCGFLGSLGSVEFHDHLIENNHFLCIRIEEPIELYCSHCGDFQYSDYFDSLLARKRKFVSEEGSDDMAASSGVSKRGLCNMGSTCFMNSVLQVLLNNETVKQVCNTLPAMCGQAGLSAANSSSSISGCIACAILNILTEFSEIEKFTSPIVPSRLLYSLWCHADYLAGKFSSYLSTCIVNWVVFAQVTINKMLMNF
jgi:hypothetical protein